jgi:hypothetical protein
MDWCQEAKMRVGVDMPGSIPEPYLQVHHEHGLEMTLGSGSIEAGPRRSEMTRVTFNAGEIGLFPRHMQTGGMEPRKNGTAEYTVPKAEEIADEQRPA